MRLILECDGALLDVMPAMYQAHVDVAAAVGWSKLDERSFRRLMRKEGPTANFLPGAKPIKLADYQRKFADQLETDESINRCDPWDDAAEVLGALARYGSICVVTLGSNVAARETALERAKLSPPVETMTTLNTDPRRRAGELRMLAREDDRAIVVACSDPILRAAEAAELFTVGLSCGPCHAARLHQAGARVVYHHLASLEESLRSGGADLVQAGLLPLPLV